MADHRRAFDWRVPAIWAVLMTISLFAHAYVEIADEASRGTSISLNHALGVEGASHVAVAALLPMLYWLHRRWPIAAGPPNLLIHALALVPFSIAHTLGLVALRLLWFNGVLGENYTYPLTLERMTYEFAKDVVNYALLSATVVGIRYLLQRTTPAAVVSARPERFAVRQRGGSEVMVDVADIDWIEASGNYAILHVGGETYEIRSSLARLESELDPKRFVHKSHVVNISRVTEVTPWVSGDWRIRLQGGAEVNLSRRYRQRFAALAPVRS